jgi:hypothetical protein
MAVLHWVVVAGTEHWVPGRRTRRRMASPSGPVLPAQAPEERGASDRHRDADARPVRGGGVDRLSRPVPLRGGNARAAARRRRTRPGPPSPSADVGWCDGAQRPRAAATRSSMSLAENVRHDSRTNPSTCQKIKYSKRKDTPRSCPIGDNCCSATQARLLAPHRQPTRLHEPPRGSARLCPSHLCT